MKRKILIALALTILVPVAGFAWLFSQREPPSGPRIAGGPTLVGVEAGGAYAWIIRYCARGGPCRRRPRYNRRRDSERAGR